NSNARSALSRESDDEFLHRDFPLRRQCTCRKLPVQTAQLMRVHVVTPKAPITVTIQPAVELPGQEGYFGTGEGPLQLSWARYYILQLPFIYSGPSGVWIPPVGVERRPPPPPPASATAYERDWCVDIDVRREKEKEGIYARNTPG
ncbi:hypothetical protein ANCDUO_12398, partial [Ancylostoma duodenale]